MAHEVESMFYAGEVPWHGLGTPLQNIATAAEAMQVAKLDWEVGIYPVKYDFEGKLRTAEDRFVIARKTDGKVYNVRTHMYTPIQNTEAFSFFDDVAGGGYAKYETAGSLKEGGIIFILAKLDGKQGSISIKGDQVDKYMLLTNSHNGEFALQMFWTPVRVVCMNTLRMALSKDAERFYSRHTKGIHKKIENAQEILGITASFYQDWTAQANHLATLQLKPAEMPLLLKAAFQLPDDLKAALANNKISNHTQDAMVMVEHLFEHGKGMDNAKIKGTKWAAYNAVAEYVDYGRKPFGNKPDARCYGAWFGSGKDVKSRAWDHLTGVKR